MYGNIGKAQSGWTRTRARMIVLTGAALLALCAAGTSAAQTNAHNDLVLPMLDCVAPVADNQFEVHLEVINVDPLADNAASNPLTDTNFWDLMSLQTLTPDINIFLPSRFLPPTTFPPGITPFTVTVDPAVDPNVYWILGNHVVVVDVAAAAADASTRCPTGPRGIQGPQGEQGPRGEAGVSDYRNVQSPTPLTVRPKSRAVLHVDCPVGMVPLSGGWNLVKGKAPRILGSFPDGNGWSEHLGNRSSKPVWVNIYAVCGR